ncbi:MAG: signal peptidase I [Planctomycetia bacterium]|nr:signal peptidase I [Planctomycetia bacterium]
MKEAILPAAGAMLLSKTPSVGQVAVGKKAAGEVRSPRATFGRPRHAALRAPLGYVVVAACLALVATTWLVRGFTVDSGSMAPALLGPHAWIKCRDCGSNFAAGVEGPASAGRPAICPLCGGADQSLPNESEAAGGDNVVVSRSAYQFRAPRRWDVVAFRAPNDASEVYVKRVVGLPGERIAIVDGDVYADGEIVRKSLAEQRALAITVHDSNYGPAASSDLPDRWQAERDTSWQKSASGFAVATTSAEGSRTLGAAVEPPIHHSSFIIHHASLDWLTYRHWRRGPDGAAESPVLDTYGYNQTYPIPELHVVRDLLLSFRLSVEGDGRLYLRASDGSNDFVCVIAAADGQVELWHDGRMVQQAAAGEPIGGLRRVELSLIDRAVLLAVDGRTLIDYPFTAAAPAPPGTARPFAIASEGLAVRIDDLRIDRDVYYGASSVARVASETEDPLALGGDEFFVLADNSPLGMDSRTPAFGPAVPAKLFVGKPLLGYGKRRLVAPWGAGIQVPALRQIRYIR